MANKFTSVPSKRLADFVDVDDMVFVPSDRKSWGGVDLVPSDFGSRAFGLFRASDNSAIEFFEWDPSTIEDPLITITKRGLRYDGSIVEDVNLKKSWIKNTTIVELGSDTPQLFQYLLDVINSGLNEGAADASETVKGIVEMATDAEIINGTSTGSTGGQLAVPAGSLYLKEKLERIGTSRVTSEASTATPTINTDNTDVHRVGPLSTNISSMTSNLSGTPSLWQLLVIELITSSSRTINWGGLFSSGSVITLPTTITGTTKMIFNWNGTTWQIIGIA